MSKRAELAALVGEARRHLELEQAYGVTGLPYSAARVAQRRLERRAKREAARANRATPPPEPPPPAVAKSAPGGSAAARPRLAPPVLPPIAPPPRAPKVASGGSGPDRRAQLDALQREMRAKCRCPLAAGKLVFSDGNPDADLMFIDEAPGEQEDLQGLPFVGPAGQLLTKIIIAMGLRREDVYISNICKFRPPQNRLPTPEEVAACLPYLRRQIEIIRPKIIVTLGNLSTHTLLDTTEGITRLRGRFAEYAPGIEIMPTFHPSYLLRDPRKKAEVWQDMKTVHARMRELGLKIGELKTGKG